MVCPLVLLERNSFLSGFSSNNVEKQWSLCNHKVTRRSPNLRSISKKMVRGKFSINITISSSTTAAATLPFSIFSNGRSRDRDTWSIVLWELEINGARLSIQSTTKRRSEWSWISPIKRQFCFWWSRSLSSFSSAWWISPPLVAGADSRWWATYFRAQNHDATLAIIRNPASVAKGTNQVWWRWLWRKIQFAVNVAQKSNWPYDAAAEESTIILIHAGWQITRSSQEGDAAAAGLDYHVIVIDWLEESVFGRLQGKIALEATTTFEDNYLSLVVHNMGWMSFHISLSICLCDTHSPLTCMTSGAVQPNRFVW